MRVPKAGAVTLPWESWDLPLGSGGEEGGVCVFACVCSYMCLYVKERGVHVSDRQTGGSSEVRV